MEKNMMVLKTVHGSHLYGLARPTSDIDLYIVNTHGKNGQDISSTPNNTEVDLQSFNLDTFMAMLHKGVPQALEALYSPVATISEEYYPLLSNFRPNLYRANETYRSTIKSQVMLADKEIDTEKRDKNLRHGLRLMLNNKTLLEHNRFIPTLTMSEKKFIASELKAGTAYSTLQQWI